MPKKQSSASKNKKSKLPPTAPKGMHDLMGERYFSIYGFAEKASEIALYYGFQPIQTPILEQENVFTSTVGEYTDIVHKEMFTLRTKGGDKLALRPEGTAAIMRSYLEHGMHTRPQPVMLYYFGPFFRHENPQRGRYREFHQFGLEIIGTAKSIADAMIINLMVVILKEIGAKNIVVNVNSLGDKESRTAFRRALQGYFKKHTASMSAHARQLIKDNPIRLLDSKDPTVIPLKENAPEAIEFLSAPSKKHFKEVLEYLDALNISYRIDNHLVRGLDYYTNTVFEITEPEEQNNKSETDHEDENRPSRLLEIGSGGRYDGLARSLGSKKNIPAVGGGIGVERLYEIGLLSNTTLRIIKKPKVFFIQLGFDAKLKSLEVVEELRKARIPLKQSLSKDSLTVQLGMAEKMNIPWVVILGQKEVIENAVIVRNMKDRSQKTIPIAELCSYLKKEIAK